MARSSTAPSPHTVVKSIALLIATLLLMSLPAKAERRLYDGVLISKAGVAPSVVDLAVKFETEKMRAERLSKNAYRIIDSHRVRRSGNGKPMEFFKGKNACRHKRVARLLKKLRAHGASYSCSLNDEQTIQTTPNDQYYSVLWGMESAENAADLNMTQAWDITTGSDSVVVGVIDTGVKYDHADLAANMWVNPGEIASNGIDDDANGVVDDIYGYNGVANNGNPMDDNGHGTHVAGTIGARGNNSVGVAGVNWNVKIMALKFLSSSGSGSTSDAIECLAYANTKGVKVTNNSWGGGGYNQALKDVIDAANTLGYLFVAAAGNSNQNIDSTPSYPASYNSANILSVAAVDRNGGRASFSNYGASGVDVGAPGVSIGSTYYDGGYVYLDGTSMASPHVAGLAGLLLACNSSLTGGQLKSTIMGTGKALGSLSGATVTGKTVDAYAALVSLGTCGGGGGGGGGTPAPEPTPTVAPTPEPTPEPTTNLVLNSSTLTPGTAATLMATVSSSGNYLIRWKLNGTPCPGQTRLRVGQGAIGDDGQTEIDMRIKIPGRFPTDITEVSYTLGRAGNVEAIATASVTPGAPDSTFRKACTNLQVRNVIAIRK